MYDRDEFVGAVALSMSSNLHQSDDVLGELNVQAVTR
jgi:hypothetical protein